METVLTKINSLKINDFSFTRLLYVKDEVIVMALVSLLKKDLYQTIFWFHELYFSNYKLLSFQSLYSFYLLFYSYCNPKFDNYFHKYYKFWCKEQCFEFLVVIIINMIKCSFSFDVFIMYNFMKNISSQNLRFTPYKGRKPLFLNHFNLLYHDCLHALYKNDLTNFCIALKTIPHDKQLFDAIIQYFILIEKISDIKLDKINFYYFNFISNELDNDILKYLLSVVLLCKSSHPQHVNLKTIYVTINEDIKNFIHNLTDYQDIPLYKFLHYKRIYGIDPIISTFNLSRFHLNSDLPHLLTFNWLYFASFSPLWNLILNNFTEDWSYDHANKKIIFPSVEEEELFNEYYCLEHDEQSLDTQEKCTLHIAPCNVSLFIDSFDSNKTHFIHLSQFLPFINALELFCT